MTEKLRLRAGIFYLALRHRTTIVPAAASISTYVRPGQSAIFDAAEFLPPPAPFRVEGRGLGAYLTNLTRLWERVGKLAGPATRRVCEHSGDGRLKAAQYQRASTFGHDEAVAVFEKGSPRGSGDRSG